MAGGEEPQPTFDCWPLTVDSAGRWGRRAANSAIAHGMSHRVYFADAVGQFTGLPTILDPATYDPATRTKHPSPNNQIPWDRFDPFAQKFSQLIPAPASAPVAALGGVSSPQVSRRRRF